MEGEGEGLRFLTCGNLRSESAGLDALRRLV